MKTINFFMGGFFSLLITLVIDLLVPTQTYRHTLLFLIGIWILINQLIGDTE